MYKIALVATALLAIASAMPNKVGMFEDEITKALQDALGPKDPLDEPSIKNVKIQDGDTDLTFDFSDATLSGFADIVCKKFTPPILSKSVTLTLNEPKVDFKAKSYDVDGKLNGKSLSAKGTAELVANNLGFTLKFKVDSYDVNSPSLCVSEGSLDIDLFVDSFEANFENADDLNDELNKNGSDLIEALEKALNEKDDDIVTNINTALCKDNKQ